MGITKKKKNQAAMSHRQNFNDPFNFGIFGDSLLSSVRDRSHQVRYNENYHQLPIYHCKKELMAKIKNNQIVVVVGK